MAVAVRPQHIPVRRAAALIGVHENTLRNWAARGIIRTVRLPGSGFQRIPTSEVDRIRAEMWRDMPNPDWTGTAPLVSSVITDDEVEWEAPLP
jgi:excisionase family DNA binding protein